MFNKQEENYMAKEFFFIENPKDWPDKVVEMINKEEHDDLF